MLCCLTWFAESDPCELCPPWGLLSRNTDTVSSRISLHSVTRRARGPLAERQTSLLSVCGRSSHWWVSVRLRCCSKPPHRAPRFLDIRFKRRLTVKTKTGMNHGKRQSNGGKKEKTSPEWPLTKRRVSSRCAREARSKDSKGRAIERFSRTTSRQLCRCDEVTSLHRTHFSGLLSANSRVKVSVPFQMLL